MERSMSEPALAIALLGRCPCTKHDVSDPTAGGTLCGAETRAKHPPPKYPTCHRPAGWGTPNGAEPYKRCKLHGGSSRITHGRFVNKRYKGLITRPRIAALVEAFGEDEDPLDILPELAAARAIFVDFVERYDAWREALLAWHADWQLKRRPLPQDLLTAFGNVVDEYEAQMREATEPTERQLGELAAARKFLDFMRGAEGAVRPREVLDVSAAMTHVDVITKIAEREWKRHESNAISRKDLFRILESFGKSVLKHVTDEETLKKIRAEWLDVTI
jgi:hypothetical protein